MYSFRQRADTKVFDEPLYGPYLKRVAADTHPAGYEVLEHLPTNPDPIIDHILLADGDTPVRFYKNMAHHLLDLDRRFLSELTNLLLIRDPKEVLQTLVVQIPEPALRDTGLMEQVEILDQILAQDEEPVVLDAKELLLNPEGVLRRACDKLGLDFDPAMLTWPAGPKPEDGAWAPHWYHNVHKSTGFAPYKPKTEPFPERLRPLLDEARPLYERLYEYAIRAA